MTQVSDAIKVANNDYIKSTFWDKRDDEVSDSAIAAISSLQLRAPGDAELEALGATLAAIINDIIEAIENISDDLAQLPLIVSRLAMS